MVIFFDLDDTLIPSTRFYDTVLKNIGIDPEGAMFLNGRKQVKSNLPLQHVSARNRLLYFKNMLETSGNFTAQQTLDLMKNYEINLQTVVQSYWHSNPDRLKIIQTLAKNFKIGILTNENCRTQLLKLTAMTGLENYIKYVVTSEEVGFEKPSAEMFKTMANRFSIGFDEVVVVGDSIENDILGAKNVGAHCVWHTEFITPSEYQKMQTQYSWINELSQSKSLQELSLLLLDLYGV